MVRNRVGLGAALIAACCMCVTPQMVNAQGLIWSLPEEDGVWVRYEGTYRNIEARPDQDEDLELNWTRWLTLSSVGRENRTVEGKEIPCRWVEIKVETGQSTAEGVETGRFGARIYKVLIPEHRVIGKVADADDIPVTFIPILEGYRKIGDRPVETLKEKVLAVYPLITLIPHFRELEAVTKTPQPLDIKLDTVNAKTVRGVLLTETKSNRSKNTTELYLSDDVPFGVAKWTVTIQREEKDELEDEEQFRHAATIEIEMEAVETGTAARSEIRTPAAN